MSEPIISVSGLRGVVGESLTPAVAMRYVAACQTVLPDGPIVLTRDGRFTGTLFADCVRGTLCGLGRTVIDAGVAATPTTGVLVRERRAAGGIQISASHNPPEYNGLKVFDSSGQVVSASLGLKVLERYRDAQCQPHWVAFDQIGDVQSCDDAISRHAELVLATVDGDAIRKRRFHVLLDSNHGAGSLLGRKLLESLGCRLTQLGGIPDGHFAHPPEPTAENLSATCREVIAAGADIGFCQDPDADRLAIIDENGRYVGEEYTLALCLDHVLQHHPGPVVTNCATSRMAADLARRFGVPCHLSPVGEANVVELMKSTEAVFGGEGNGGPIDPRVGYVRDSFVGMALVLHALTSCGRRASEAVDALPRYYIHKSKIAVPGEQMERALDNLAGRFSDAAASRMDGLRLDWPDRWLLVRASNTEPIVRAIAEAPTRKAAEQLCAEACKCLGVVFKSQITNHKTQANTNNQ